MGLLDSLMRSAKRKATRMAVNAIVDEISKSAQNKNAEASAPVAQNNVAPVQASAPVVQSNVSQPQPKQFNIEDEFIDDKLDYVLKNEFPQYEIRKKVSPVTLGGTGKFMDYDLGVYENGAPKLFIMMVGPNTCSKREYRWSKEEAAKAGVPMINFVMAFSNKIDYITNRLHQYL